MNPIPDTVRFCTYRYNGTPHAYYIAERRTLPTATPSQDIGHLKLVVDRSGSMYYDMAEMRTLIEKLLTIEEYADAGLIVSLYSYSSQGDYTVHFERVAVADILKPGSRHVEAIRSLRATAMTCASQAMWAAAKDIRPNETTGIVLFTDGYFNHFSPAQEQREFDRIVAALRPQKNVLLNTISFRHGDFVLLDRIANALSGKCIQAQTLKQVYDAIHDTSTLLAGRTVPAVVIDADGADYQTFTNVTQRKINGTTLDLSIRGLAEHDDVAVWRYRKVTEDRWYMQTQTPIASHETTLLPVYAFARAKLAEGHLSAAKYAVVATRDRALLEEHAKALTPEQLGKFAEAIENRMFDPGIVVTYSTEYGLQSKRAAIPVVLRLLQQHKADWTLDLLEFLSTYKKRGVKRLQGTWREVSAYAATGSDSGEVTQVFVPATYRLLPVDDPTIVSVSSFDFNNDTANINMLVNREAHLFGPDGRITLVAGKKLSLKTFNNYTLVGDGAVNARVLPIRIASQHLHAALCDLGALDRRDAYDPGRLYLLGLDRHPVVAYDATFDPPTLDRFAIMMTLRVLSGILAACLPDGEKAEAWTPEQLVTLKAHFLTAALNFSPPTTNPYTDLDAAVAAGLVDTRTTYRIGLLSPTVAGLGALWSANEYLNRRFKVKRGDAAPEVCGRDGYLKKAAWTDVRAPGATVELKPLSDRTKLGPVDDVMMPIFEVALGRGSMTLLADRTVPGLDTRFVFGGSADLAVLKRALDMLLEDGYQHLRPLAFYIGATGLLPDAWGDVKALTAEKLVERFPSLELEKKQLDGTFFVLDSGSVIGVYAENAYFSTPAGVDAAAEIAHGAEEAA